MSYRKLEVWQLAREMVIEIHQLSLNLLGIKLNNFLRTVEEQHQSPK